MQAPARGLHRDSRNCRNVPTVAALLETTYLKVEGHLCPLLLSRVAWPGGCCLGWGGAALDSDSALGDLDSREAGEGEEPLFIPGVPGHTETGWPARMAGRPAAPSVSCGDSPGLACS